MLTPADHVAVVFLEGLHRDGELIGSLGLQNLAVGLPGGIAGAPGAAAGGSLGGGSAAQVIDFRSTAVGSVAVQPVLNGQNQAPTLGGTTVLPPGGSLQLFAEAPGPWGAMDYPAELLVQWARVADAERYELRTTSGAVVAEVLDDGRSYLQHTFDGLVDGVAYAWDVVALGAGEEVGSARRVYGVMVTRPTETPPAIAYNGDGTVDIG